MRGHLRDDHTNQRFGGNRTGGTYVLTTGLVLLRAAANPPMEVPLCAWPFGWEEAQHNAPLTLFSTATPDSLGRLSQLGKCEK